MLGGSVCIIRGVYQNYIIMSMYRTRVWTRNLHGLRPLPAVPFLTSGIGV